MRTMATLFICASLINATSARDMCWLLGGFTDFGCKAYDVAGLDRQVISNEDMDVTGFEHCADEVDETSCTVGCQGGWVWYGPINPESSKPWVGKYLEPHESIECSNDGFACDPACSVFKQCYIENNDGGSCCADVSTSLVKTEGKSCKNNYYLGSFDCPIDCARAAATNAQCSGSSKIMFDRYYSAEHASWGCRCCKDNTLTSHDIWEIYDYADAERHPDFAHQAKVQHIVDEPRLDAPSEPLPKTNVFEIMMDRKAALGALAVLVLLSLSISLCLYRQCACGGRGAKPAVYRKVEMVSSADEAEEEPMM